jgi:hypothetical protein
MKLLVLNKQHKDDWLKIQIQMNNSQFYLNVNPHNYELSSKSILVAEGRHASIALDTFPGLFVNTGVRLHILKDLGYPAYVPGSIFGYNKPPKIVQEWVLCPPFFKAFKLSA